MAQSVRAIVRKCLKKFGSLSVQSDILELRQLPPPRSLRDELNFILNNRCPPERPTGLRVTGVADRKISVAWSDRSDNENGFSIQFRGKKAGESDHTGSKSVGSNKESATLDDLRSNHQYTISVVAFNAGGQSPRSNEVQATTPTVEETITVSVSLGRVVVTQGPIPYLGWYPPFGVVPPGRLLRIRFPLFGWNDVALAFVKRGHSTQECNDASAVVVISEGQTTTSSQLKEIYGVAEPRFTTADPIPFLACIRTATPSTPLPGFINIEIDVIFD